MDLDKTTSAVRLIPEFQECEILCFEIAYVTLTTRELYASRLYSHC